jgi:hypothetical protein
MSERSGYLVGIGFAYNTQTSGERWLLRTEDKDELD